MVLIKGIRRFQEERLQWQQEKADLLIEIEELRLRIPPKPPAPPFELPLKPPKPPRCKACQEQRELADQWSQEAERRTEDYKRAKEVFQAQKLKWGKEMESFQGILEQNMELKAELKKTQKAELEAMAATRDQERKTDELRAKISELRLENTTLEMRLTEAEITAQRAIPMPVQPPRNSHSSQVSPSISASAPASGEDEHRQMAARAAEFETWTRNVSDQLVLTDQELRNVCDFYSNLVTDFIEITCDPLARLAYSCNIKTPLPSKDGHPKECLSRVQNAILELAEAVRTQPRTSEGSTMAPRSSIPKGTSRVSIFPQPMHPEVTSQAGAATWVPAGYTHYRGPAQMHGQLHTVNPNQPGSFPPTFGRLGQHPTVGGSPSAVATSPERATLRSQPSSFAESVRDLGDEITSEFSRAISGVFGSTTTATSSPAAAAPMGAAHFGVAASRSTHKGATPCSEGRLRGASAIDGMPSMPGPAGSPVAKAYEFVPSTVTPNGI